MGIVQRGVLMIPIILLLVIVVIVVVARKEDGATYTGRIEGNEVYLREGDQGDVYDRIYSASFGLRY